MRFIDIRFTWVTTCTLHNWDHPYILGELENVLTFGTDFSVPLVRLILDKVQRFWFYSERGITMVLEYYCGIEEIRQLIG